MKDRPPSIDELIVGHINSLAELVQKDVVWMESQPDLNSYSLHVSNLESNLQRHAERMLALRERVVKQLATKCGPSGADVYGSELSNIRKRRFFAKIASLFCRKFDD
jgi:hypothetical protein